MRILLVTIAVLISIVTFSSCKKDTVTTTIVEHDTVTTYPIQGLWEGTYIDHVSSITYYFGFSLYADGTASYKSAGSTADYYTFATGTWTLSGTSFSFSGETINAISGTQIAVTATATYDATNGTLTNGTVTPSNAWSMAKVN